MWCIEGRDPRVSSDKGIETNLAFDASLRARNPEWGLRDTADVKAAATAAGFALTERRAMPANNLMLLFRYG